jgi:YVTN family beta-propeller protein
MRLYRWPKYRFAKPKDRLQHFGINTFMKSLALYFIAGIVACSSVLAEASKGFVVICNKGDMAMGIIDPVVGRQIATVAEEGTTGHELATSPDGKLAFVPIYGNSGVGHPGTDGSLIRVIDLDQRRIVGTIDFGKGVRPHCAVFGPKDGLLYVTTELENAVSIIDPKAFKIVGSIPTGQAESHMLAITHDNRKGYTANVGPGTVSVLDVANRKLIKTISISSNTQRISVSADDRWVFSSDQTKPRLAVIDTSKDELSRWVDMPGLGYGTAPTPDGRWLVVALISVNKVGIVDLKSMTIAQTIDAPKAPQYVLMQPDGAKAYVSCDASKKVLMIDTATWKVEKEIEAGKTADGMAWASR